MGLALARLLLSVAYVLLAHAASATHEPRLAALLKSWQERGIPKKAVEAFYQAEMEILTNQNRAAFLLASNLDGERFIPENHQALAKLPKMQQWREQAREMTGFYSSLEKHADRIQQYFDAKGVKYSVRQRIQERGFPLGGRARPRRSVGRR